MRKRASTEAAKAGRRDAIVSAAADAFDRLGFAATSMDWLAERAGVAKGTVYLYFATKETVFLALYRRELDAWFADVDERMDSLAQDDAMAFAGLVVDALEARPRLPALAAILHTVLERNAGEEDILDFKRHLMDRHSATGRRIEEKLGFLAEDDGVRLLQRLHALTIGCWHAAQPAAVVRRVLSRDEFAPLRSDFSEELENTLALLLEGWRHGGGGF